MGNEGGDDGKVVADVDDPAGELYTVSPVGLFECAYLLADGIEGDVVACARVRFVEGVHECSGEGGRNGKRELISATEIRLSEESRNDLE